jgi:hypothetical protein
VWLSEDVWVPVVFRRLDGKGEGTKIVQVKFFWMGNVKEIHGVGLLVADRGAGSEA